SELNVDPRTAEKISDYMVNVRAILSYAFLGKNDKFLGILSIDIRDSDTAPDVNKRVLKIVPSTSISGSQGDGFAINADDVSNILIPVGKTLESFEHFKVNV
ncbi:MAG: hypothetical protein AB1478_06530, partial [Nitrospirota bacterium]